MREALKAMYVTRDVAQNCHMKCSKAVKEVGFGTARCRHATSATVSDRFAAWCTATTSCSSAGVWPSGR